MNIFTFLLILVITVVMLCVLTIKCKMHPVLVLFLCAMFVAISSGLNVVEAISKIKSGFGSTLSSVGLMIIFGSVIACGIQDSGAVTGMVNWFIKVFKGKHLELAPALEAFIVSIPVFGDIASILNAPIASIIAKRKNMSMTEIAPIIKVGITLTHGLVPPTPGILAVTVLLGADLGEVVLLGLICSIISFFAMYFTLCKYYKHKHEYIAPLTEYTEGIDPVPDDAPVEALLIPGEKIPSAFTSFLPLLLPALLITIGSVGKIFASEETAIYSVFNTFSDGVFALFFGMVAAMCLSFGRLETVRTNAIKSDKNLKPDAGYLEICCNSWFSRALKISIGPLLITAMGGALASVLKNQDLITEIAEVIAASSFPKLLIPFILTAVLMGICGSMTTAAITSASLMLPMLSTLGISPVCCTLAIGAGSMCFWHANNSGFWVFTSLYGFNTKQGYYYFTGMLTAGGIVAFLVVLLMSVLGIF